MRELPCMIGKCSPHFCAADGVGSFFRLEKGKALTKKSGQGIVVEVLQLGVAVLVLRNGRKVRVHQYMRTYARALRASHGECS